MDELHFAPPFRKNMVSDSTSPTKNKHHQPVLASTILLDHILCSFHGTISGNRQPSTSRPRLRCHSPAQSRPKRRLDSDGRLCHRLRLRHGDGEVASGRRRLVAAVAWVFSGVCVCVHRTKLHALRQTQPHVAKAASHVQYIHLSGKCLQRFSNNTAVVLCKLQGKRKPIFFKGPLSEKMFNHPEVLKTLKTLVEVRAIPL